MLTSALHPLKSRNGIWATWSPISHAFIIRSPELRMLALFNPGGIEEAFRVGNAPAKHLGLPENAITHSTADLGETARRMKSRGVRLLTPDEIENQMPSYHRMANRT
jgi:hypothetical protein